MFYVSLSGSSKRTLRCYASICDGIIFLVVVIFVDVFVAWSGDDQLNEKNIHHCFDQFIDET